MKVDKVIFRMSLLTVVCLCAFSCFSCGNNDDLSAPQIESVWNNMSTQPIEQVDCSYPQQTICLRGSGFSGVGKLIVNGTEIDLTDTKIYNTDNSIIVALPKEVATTTSTGQAYLQVENAVGKAVYEPFYVFDSSEKPKITSFSSTALTSGSTLRIAGSNLGGAVEVYLPLAFDQKVLCEFDANQTSSDTEIFVIVPEGVTFAQGQVEIVMHKTYAGTGDEYTTKAYSDVTNFSN